MRIRRLVLGVLTVLALLATTSTPAGAHDPTGSQAESLKGRLYDGHVDEVSPGGVPMEPLSGIDCKNGMAGIFPCDKVNLSSFLPLTMIDSTFVNDVWGWEDPDTGMQVAIVGSIDGTRFIDVTDGENPVFLGSLESPVPGDFFNLWGDIRVYENTAYIGSEVANADPFGHGVQVVDMTQFRGVTPPITAVEANRITDMTNSHNLSLNTDTGRLYVVGSFLGLSECVTDPGTFVNGNGGALVYDVASDPLNPRFLGCLTEDGYIHDIQCVVYHGEDTDHQGSEICIGSNEDTVTVYDATDMSNPVVLDRIAYVDWDWWNPEIGAPNFYTHQGWLSGAHNHFYVGDELDEFFGGNPQRSTYIIDVSDLDDLELIGTHTEDSDAIDHNMFVLDDLLYQSNYTAGLTILDTNKAHKGELQTKGYFDIYPANDDRIFGGSWGNFPFFGDGKVIVTSSDEGVFVLESRVRPRNDNPNRPNIR